MQRYVLALDQGTTSSRAILFDQAQNIVQVAQKEFTQFYPQAGWVEQDPMEIYASQYAVMMEAITQSGIEPKEIAAIGITNPCGADLRASDRRLFFRHQDQVAAGPCAGRPGQGGGRGPALWHGGHLAGMEAHQRQSPCDRLYQRLPHHAL